MVSINGNDLTIEQVCAVARGRETVEIAAAAMEAMRRSRLVVEKLAAGDAPVYAVNTGVGRSGSTPKERGAVACGGRGRSAAHQRGSRDDADPR
jgi:histidine ammonia-lyase